MTRCAQKEEESRAGVQERRVRISTGGGGADQGRMPVANDWEVPTPLGERVWNPPKAPNYDQALQVRRAC